MGLLANPWAIVVIVLGLVASHGAVGYKAYHVGQDALIAAQAKEDAKTAEVRQEVLDFVAEKLAEMKVEHQTIRQKTEVITREVPVYRDCQHDDVAFGLLNDALTPPDRRGAGGGDQGKLP